jgi:peptidoglycan/LPS O-acetylase OafA/YrhL
VAAAAFVGVISYGVYLLHMLSANAVRAVMHQTYGVLVFAATLATVITVAYFSFRYFETPLLKLKRRFEPRTSARATR